MNQTFLYFVNTYWWKQLFTERISYITRATTWMGWGGWTYSPTNIISPTLSTSHFSLPVLLLSFLSLICYQAMFSTSTSEDGGEGRGFVVGWFLKQPISYSFKVYVGYSVNLKGNRKSHLFCFMGKQEKRKKWMDWQCLTGIEVCHANTTLKIPNMINHQFLVSYCSSICTYPDVSFS